MASIYWWNDYPHPAPLFQPPAAVIPVSDAILREAAEVYALSGLTPSTDRRALLEQMGALHKLATGARYDTALKRLRSMT